MLPSSFLEPLQTVLILKIISPPPSSMAFSFNNDYSPPPPSSDDISLFLRQLLHRSSSSTPSSSLQPPPLLHSVNQNAGFSSSSTSTVPPESVAGLDGYLRLPSQPAADHVSPSAGLSFWSEIPTGVCSNLTSSSTAPLESDSPTAGSGQLRSAENDVDDYDCESEEGPEDAQPKHNPQRNSSKRTRAAEVHNQSEKRRRSRINEKMKALQNLIPNSNKTDKASMLDEAIEYLKQLQLQVQMLSMRNGLVLHPMCLPGFPGGLDPVQLCQLGLDFSNKDGSLDAGIPNTLPPAPLDSLRGSIAAEAPFSLQSSMANQLSSFHLLENICRGESQSNGLGGNGFNTESSSTRMPMPISYAEDGTQGVIQNNSTSHVELISSNNHLDGVSQGTTV